MSFVISWWFQRSWLMMFSWWLAQLLPSLKPPLSSHLAVRPTHLNLAHHTNSCHVLWCPTAVFTTFPHRGAVLVRTTVTAKQDIIDGNIRHNLNVCHINKRDRSSHVKCKSGRFYFSNWRMRFQSPKHCPSQQILFKTNHVWQSFNTFRGSLYPGF